MSVLNVTELYTFKWVIQIQYSPALACINCAFLFLFKKMVNSVLCEFYLRGKKKRKKLVLSVAGRSFVRPPYREGNFSVMSSWERREAWGRMREQMRLCWVWKEIVSWHPRSKRMKGTQSTYFRGLFIANLKCALPNLPWGHWLSFCTQEQNNTVYMKRVGMVSSMEGENHQLDS